MHACLYGKLTISDNRAKAGSNVCGASLCLSMASRTRTNLHLGSLVGSFNMVLKITDSCASVSQRLCLLGNAADVDKSGWPAGPSNSRASATDPTMRSNKCLPVMHWAAFTIAYFNPPLCGSVVIFSLIRTSSRSVMLDLPVASVPWRTRFRHGAASGYRAAMWLADNKQIDLFRFRPMYS